MKIFSKYVNILESGVLSFLMIVSFSCFSTSEIYSQINSKNNDSSIAENQKIEQLKNKPRKGLFYISLGSGNPQGDFQSNIGSGGFGVIIGGGYSFEKIFGPTIDDINSSIVTGVDIGFISLTSNKRPALYSYKYDNYQYRNSTAPINLFARYQIDILHWIFPYAELSAGINIYSATSDGEYSELVTKTDGQKVWETRTDEIYSDRTVFTNYGVSTGIMIKMVENITLPNSASSILLDLKARYLYGNPTDYKKVKDVDKYGTTIYEQFTNAGTDMLFVHMGIAFRF